MNSFADAWKMRAMSAARLCTARLAALIALATLSLIAGCTAPTPYYCNQPGTAECLQYPGYTCTLKIHTCQLDSTAVDASDASAGDAPADAPTDGGTTEDHPASTDGAGSADGPRGDASDASADVFHGCVNNNGCPDSTKPVCQTDGGVCVGCLQNADCKAAATPACDTAVNKCVECLVNGDCTDPTKPVCDKQACRRCAVDSECAGVGPGVCMFHIDGHCATDSETVYVAPTGLGGHSCSDSAANAGTSQTPFCTSQAGIDATTPSAVPPVDAGGGSNDGGSVNGDAGTDGDSGPGASPKSLVIMHGLSLPDWSFNVPDRTITVVGQSNATLSPGGRIGIHVSGGTVYVRSLHVTGGGLVLPGIIADGGEVHLDRCVVDLNQAGGVQVDNAGFEITNSVLAGNGVGKFNGAISWSGAYLGAVPSGKPAIFRNNTVIHGMAPGVVCPMSNAHDLNGSIFFDNAVADTLVCNVTSCCSGDPALNASYHFTAAASPCKDQLSANMSTAYDIDGDPRPYGTLSDCGADEYVAPTP